MTKKDLLKQLENLHDDDLVYVVTRAHPFGYSIIDKVANNNFYELPIS